MKRLKQYFFFCLYLLPILLSAQNDTCNYKIQLIDFFGDGWDGAELTVIIQGDTNKYTLPDSIIGFVEIPAIQNEGLQIFFSEGAFDEEISYIVFDPTGTIIFNDGPFPDTGLVVDIIACPTCPTPTNLQVNTGDDNALAHWNASKSALNYVLEYGEKDFSLGAGTTLITSDTFINITDLAPFREYDSYLWATCALIEDNPTIEVDTSLTKLKASFTTRFAKDVGITSIAMPNSGCGLTDEEMITIALKNFGANPQSLIPFRFSVNGMDGGVMVPSDGFYTNVLSKDSVALIEFETTYDFSQAGIYEIAVWTELQGDNQVANDTAYLQIQSIPTISTFPYSQDFETGINGWSAVNNTDDFSWELGQSNPIYGGGDSWVVEAKENNISSQQTYLYSPCLDFSNHSTDLKVAFQLWINTTAPNTQCWIEMSQNEGENWQRVSADSLAINWYNNDGATAWTNQTATGNWRYVESTLPNSAQQANSQLRIVFENSEAETIGQKIAIDDVQIFPASVTNIVALRAQNTAIAGCGVTADTVELLLYNAGQTELSNLNVHYQINDGAIISENTDGLIIASGDQAIYPFKTPFNASIPTAYTIKSWVSLVNDALPISDTTYFQFTVDPPLPLPFVEDFEDQVVDEGWFALGNAEVAIRGPFDHNNESHIMAVNLWTGATRTAIHTANYGVIAAGDSLSLDYRFVLWDDSNIPLTLAGDSLIIAISTDCGNTFNRLMVIDEVNHLPTAEFQTVKLDLSDYAGQNGVFRFTALWAQSDYWLDIDNITVLSNEVTTSTEIIPTNIADFRLFPNPSNGWVQLELSLLKKAPIVIQILNSTGQLVFQDTYSNSDYFNQQLDLSGFPSGIYFVKIEANQENISRKLIIVD